MLVKVCGMRDSENIAQISSLPIDMIGFIFYHKSQRFVKEQLPSTLKGIYRVGVFVDSDIEYILDIVKENSLDVVQLHGDESVDLCEKLKQQGLKVIKAISVSSIADLAKVVKFDGKVDFILLDTKTDLYGGSGLRFDWDILNHYSSSTPFILSGGIDEESAEQIIALKHNRLVGIDLNSRFELSPAIKDVIKLKNFISKIKNYSNE